MMTEDDDWPDVAPVTAWVGNLLSDGPIVADGHLWLSLPHCTLESFGALRRRGRDPRGTADQQQSAVALWKKLDTEPVRLQAVRLLDADAYCVLELQRQDGEFAYVNADKLTLARGASLFDRMDQRGDPYSMIALSRGGEIVGGIMPLRYPPGDAPTRVVVKP